MKSKNKNLFLKIYIPFVIVTIIALIVLQILGSKKRVGYLTDFNINKAFELNNLEYIINEDLDEETIKNYFLTNESITNYTYHFRIRYYDKVFRNSDIYGVYLDLSGLPDFVKEVKMDYDGSPFGILISDKLITEEKIDDVGYILKIKYYIVNIYITFLVVFLLIITHQFFISIIHNIYLFFLSLYKKYGGVIYKIYSIFIVCLILVTIIFKFLGNIEREASLENFELIAESPAGYVYKSYVKTKGIFTPNFIYKYSNKPLRLDNKTNYIKNYGYSYYINKIPYINSLNNENIGYDNGDSFTIFDSVNYHYPILISKGEYYRILIALDKDNNNSETIKIGLSIPNVYTHGFSYLSNTYNNYEIYGEDVYIHYTRHTESKINFYFPNEYLDIKSISIEQINNDELYVKDNSYITFTTYEKIIDKENIPNVYVKFDLNQSYIITFIFIILLYLMYLLYYAYNKYNTKLENNTKSYISDILNKNDYTFIIILTVASILLFVFQFWLFFPGYFLYPDNLGYLLESKLGIYTNHSGIIIPLLLNCLYKIYGFANYYLFLINLLLFQSALYLIILSLYLKFKNKFIILLLAITFIPNLFFLNMNQIKDNTAALWIFFAYSLIFFKINTNLNKITNVLVTIIYIISIFFALLWRHNFIVTVYPIFILFAYNIVKNKSILKFISIMMIFAIILVLIHYSFPRIFTKDEYLMSNALSQNIFDLQIASCAVPANDGSLIVNDWYIKGKSFEDVKKAYNDDPLNADQFIYGEKRVFRYVMNLEKHKEVWIKYIIKYPINYIKHISNFAKHLWVTPTWKIDSKQIQENFSGLGGIKFTPLKANIYSFLYKFLGDINILIYVIISILLFFITGLLYILKSIFRTELLIFSFCTAFSAVATAIITALFGTMPLYRYIHPVCPIAIISLISFITFIYDRGGFKKFIKELRGNKK